MITMKYHNNTIYYDTNTKLISSILDKSNKNLIRFDSTFEYKVYQELLLIYPSNTIMIHYPVEIFNNIFWKCDFKVSFDNTDYYYEAKGFMTDKFKLQMKILKQYNVKLWQNLILVINNHKQVKPLLKYCNNVLVIEQLYSFIKGKKTNDIMV